MLERWFLAHPRSLDQGYFEHQACALRFSGSLLKAGFACLVHALVPALFERTASGMVERLHGEMVTHRRRQEATAPRAVVPAATLSRLDA